LHIFRIAWQYITGFYLFIDLFDYFFLLYSYCKLSSLSNALFVHTPCEMWLTISFSFTLFVRRDWSVVLVTLLVRCDKFCSQSLWRDWPVLLVTLFMRRKIDRYFCSHSLRDVTDYFFFIHILCETRLTRSKRDYSQWSWCIRSLCLQSWLNVSWNHPSTVMFNISLFHSKLLAIWFGLIHFTSVSAR